MSFFRVFIVGVYGLLYSVSVFAHVQSFSLDMGQMKVIHYPSIDRVAIGDGQIISVMTDEHDELVIFAKQTGYTNMTVWNKKGDFSEYQIEVKSLKKKQFSHDLILMLKKIPYLKATFLDEKVMVEGQTLGVKDRQLLDRIIKHFPQVVDMTTPNEGDEMILLDVQVLEVPRRVLEQMGVKWGMGAEMRVGLNQSVLSAPELFNMNASISASLKILNNQGNGVILAHPQLMARSGAPASFMAGGEVPYVVSTEKGGYKTIFKPYGVKLDITPFVNEKKVIRGKIHIEVSHIDFSLSVESGPSFKTRKADTEFNVKSGQTIILAGFISKQERTAIDQVPVLGDIPVLGHLFKSKQFQKEETELAILVRPLLLDDKDPMMKKSLYSSKYSQGYDTQYTNPFLGPLMDLPRYLKEGRTEYDPRVFHPRWKPIVVPPFIHHWH